MNTIIGTNIADKLKGTSSENNIDGLAGNDTITGGAANDFIQGGKGSDVIYGREGNDVLIGDAPAEFSFKTDLITIAEDYKVKVTFDFEEAGYRNTLGVYKVDPKTGEIGDVEIIWANASLKGSGGDLIGGQSQFEYPVAAGEQIGFFLIGNGFSVNDFNKLASGELKFVTPSGKPATVDTAGAKLVSVAPNGKITAVNGPTYHTAAFGDRTKLNSDNTEHTMGYKTDNKGSFQIGFEDLWQGGDRDFDDAVFTVDIGKASIEVLNKHYDTVLKAATEGIKINNASYMKVDVAHDRLQGGAGADTLEGMQGNDLLAGGGAGAEWKLVNGSWVYNAKAIIKGAGFKPDGSDDNVSGGTGHDVLLGGGGNDKLDGGDGNDTLNAGTGNDVALGGAGNDVINGEDGNDYADGGTGNDIINAGKGDDVGYGGAGADSLRGAEGNDSLYGGDDADDIQGGTGNDLLSGDAGDDKLIGGDGDDKMLGGDGADTLDGGTGNDNLDGGAGNDVLNGEDGNDYADGGAGNDIINAGKGDDVGYGGAGADSLRGAEGNDSLYGGDDADDIQGGIGNDLLSGDAGDDKLFGADGNDKLMGGDGADYLEGGIGTDSLEGGAGDDRLIAGEGNDLLQGGAGKDQLVGGKGSDIINGGAGDDQLWGGEWSADKSQDVFVHQPGGGKDQVNDFEIASDRLDLSAYGLNYSNLASRIVDKGWATEIDLSGLQGAQPGDMLVLKSVKAIDLTEDKFIL